MTRSQFTAVCIAATLAAAVVQVQLIAGAQASNPFVGYWALEPLKSTFNPDAKPEKRVTWFQVMGDSITHTREQQDGFGSTQQMKYTAKFDGKDYPVSGSAMDTVALKRTGPSSFERVGKIRGEVVENVTFTVSPDGKTLTLAAKGDNGERQYDNVEIYTRAPMPAGKR